MEEQAVTKAGAMGTSGGRAGMRREAGSHLGGGRRGGGPLHVRVRTTRRGALCAAQQYAGAEGPGGWPHPHRRRRPLHLRHQGSQVVRGGTERRGHIAIYSALSSAPPGWSFRVSKVHDDSMAGHMQSALRKHLALLLCLQRVMQPQTCSRVGHRRPVQAVLRAAAQPREQSGEEAVRHQQRTDEPGRGSDSAAPGEAASAWRQPAWPRAPPPRRSTGGTPRCRSRCRCQAAPPWQRLRWLRRPAAPAGLSGSCMAMAVH